MLEKQPKPERKIDMGFEYTQYKHDHMFADMPDLERELNNAKELIKILDSLEENSGTVDGSNFKDLQDAFLITQSIDPDNLNDPVFKETLRYDISSIDSIREEVEKIINNKEAEITRIKSVLN